MNTKSKIATIAVALGMAASSSISYADEDADLVVNGEIEMVVRTAAPAHLEGAVSTIYSGWVFRSDETQAMQADDFDNPGMLFVEKGEQLFNTAMGADGQSCASCHQSSDLTNVRATYPQWDAEHSEVQTVEMQVRECQTEQMGMEEPWGINSGDMLDITAFIASIGRGQIVDVAIDGPAHETWELGREIYYTRFGQLELSCANCHEENYGNRIRADHLSQGQINGFPTYRLKNARLNGVQNRFRGCVRDTRAETYGIGSDEFVALELYVASRGNGLTVEGPSVRN
ncbi:MAG: sulfur oxidation c-type cytochrome SoxA [Pseudomonadales bacterium]